MREYHVPQIRSGNVKEAEPIDNCGIGQPNESQAQKRQNPLDGGFKLRGKVTTLSRLQEFLRTALMIFNPKVVLCVFYCRS